MLSPAMSSKGVVLILLHQAHSQTGRVGRLLQRMGFDLDVRYPLLGDALPQSLERHCAVVVFGGPMSANDDCAFIRREIDWLGTPLREGKPYLGLCLGAQLMARQLGAKVEAAPSKCGEVGYHPLKPVAGADALCGAPMPRQVFQWHSEGFDLPCGARLLAQGVGEFPNQAYLVGDKVVGLQFHPEVTYHMMCRWLTRNPQHPREEHLAGWFVHDGAVERWISAFLRVWIEGRMGVYRAAAE